MSTEAIVLLAVLILISPLLLMASAWWLRLFISAWVVLVRRLLGRGDKSKHFADEVTDMASSKSEYAKMKREFDEQAERVRKSIADRRGRGL